MPIEVVTDVVTESIPIWRYMNLRDAGEMLMTRKMRFTRADVFTDHLEGTIGQKTRLATQQVDYFLGEHSGAGLIRGTADFNLDETRVRKYNYISCFTKSNPAQNPMWNKNPNLTENSIALKTDIKKLSESISRDVMFGKIAEVQYVNHSQEDYYEFDSNDYLLKKDTSYAYEAEVRFIINLQWDRPRIRNYNLDYLPAYEYETFDQKIFFDFEPNPKIDSKLLDQFLEAYVSI